MDIGEALVGAALSWLKGLASGVLRLFNLAGGGAQPLLWLSRHWLKLLMILMIAGIVIDIWVWLLRWRPHWAWFRKKRIVVNDARMVAEPDDTEDMLFAGDEDRPKKQYVVPRGEAPSAQRRMRHASTGRTRPGRRDALETEAGTVPDDSLFDMKHIPEGGDTDGENY